MYPQHLWFVTSTGFDEAKEKLEEAKPLFKPFPHIYLSFKEAMRILRKMKYDEVKLSQFTKQYT
jgi:hypothetical protein